LFNDGRWDISTEKSADKDRLLNKTRQKEWSDLSLTHLKKPLCNENNSQPGLPPVLH
jgi:hypothetical protein